MHEDSKMKNPDSKMLLYKRISPRSCSFGTSYETHIDAGRRFEKIKIKTNGGEKILI